MKVEIYRKRSLPFGEVVDDEPQTVFENVSQIEITKNYIFGNIDGEQLTIKMDHVNYKYSII